MRKFKNVMLLLLSSFLQATIHHSLLRSRSEGENEAALTKNRTSLEKGRQNLPSIEFKSGTKRKSLAQKTPSRAGSSPEFMWFLPKVSKKKFNMKHFYEKKTLTDLLNSERCWTESHSSTEGHNPEKKLGRQCTNGFRRWAWGARRKTEEIFNR